MTPSPEPLQLAASSGSGPGLFTFLAASALVIGLAYAASRLMGSWQTVQTRGRRLRVLEGVPIGRDRTLLLVSVGKEVLVLGSSPSGVHLVHRVADEQSAAELLAAPEPSGKPVPEVQAVENAVRVHLERMRSVLGKVRGKANG